MLKKIGLTIIALLVYLLPLIAKEESKSFFFNQTSIENGLSQSQVTSICRDYKGMLWIGTVRGLNQLNRGELSVYYNDKSQPNSIPSNHIYQIKEDFERTLWVSTENGLCKYNPLDDSFEMVLEKKIFSIESTSSAIFFGGNGYVMIREGSKFEKIILEKDRNNSLNNSYDVVAMGFRPNIKKQEELMVATRNQGVYLISLETKAVKKTNIPTNGATLQAFYVNKEDHIYLSTYNNGLFCYTKDGELLDHYSTENSGININIILDIMEKNNKIWLATDGGGINIIDKETKHVSIIKNIPSVYGSIPVNSLTTLYEDQGNNFWIGSVRGGLISMKEVYLRSYKEVPYNTVNGITEKTVICVFEDNDNTVWIGTDGGGLNSYDTRLQTFTHYKDTYKDKIVSITNYSENKLLLSIYPEGLFLFDKMSKTKTSLNKLNHLINIKRDNNGFQPFAHHVAKDKIYIISDGLYTYSPHLGDPVPLKYDNSIDPRGMLLIHTDSKESYTFRDNNLFRISQQTDSIELFKSITENINTASYDGDSIFWIGTNTGLSKLNTRTGEFSYNNTNVFANVSSLYLDNKKKLWIGAQNRLFLYLIEEDKYILWDESDGFALNELLYMYQQESKSKYIYLGGTAGFVVINKEAPTPIALSPNIQLVDLTVNGAKALHRFDLETRELIVPSNYTSLNITFGLGLINVFDKTIFKYELIGEDDTHVIETYDHTYKPPFLSAGKYFLRVSYNTKNGEWTPPSSILSIVIKGPWYTESWVLAFLTFMLIGIIILTSVFYYKKQQRQLRLHLKLQEQQVKEEKLNFFVNISHELKTPLSLIHAPLSRILSEDTLENALKMKLNKMYNQTKRMSDIINMTLNFDKEDNSIEILTINSHNINEFIDDVSNYFTSEFEYKGITLALDLAVDLPEIEFDKEKCALVLSNLLSNALKFSIKGTTVIVRSALRDQYVSVSVVDEGIGIKDIDTDQLFERFFQGNHQLGGSGIGLSYAKKIITSHQGLIGAQQNTIGATFYFELPRQSSLLHNSLDINSKINVEYLNDTLDLDTKEYSLLIVEDNKELLEFLYSSLGYMFHEVFIANDGEEALNYLKEEEVHIIISDVMMPKINGYELCRIVKSDIKNDHIPIILLTARDDMESKKHGYIAGADSYISKPFDIETLLFRIKNLLKNKKGVIKKYKQKSGLSSIADITDNREDDKFIKKMNEYIIENISNPNLEVNDLVEALSLSRASLYTKVKNLTNQGVKDYINTLRIERAKALLIESDARITDISIQVGFTSQRYFSSVFKEMVGDTPSEYRAKNN